VVWSEAIFENTVRAAAVHAPPARCLRSLPGSLWAKNFSGLERSDIN
jgi:hypothetical protein